MSIQQSFQNCFVKFKKNKIVEQNDNASLIGRQKLFYLQNIHKVKINKSKLTCQGVRNAR